MNLRLINPLCGIRRCVLQDHLNISQIIFADERVAQAVQKREENNRPLPTWEKLGVEEGTINIDFARKSKGVGATANSQEIWQAILAAKYTADEEGVVSQVEPDQEADADAQATYRLKTRAELGDNERLIEDLAVMTAQKQHLFARVRQQMAVVSADETMDIVQVECVSRRDHQKPEANQKTSSAKHYAEDILKDYKTKKKQNREHPTVYAEKTPDGRLVVTSTSGSLEHIRAAATVAVAQGGTGSFRVTGESDKAKIRMARELMRFNVHIILDEQKPGKMAKMANKLSGNKLQGKGLNTPYKQMLAQVKAHNARVAAYKMGDSLEQHQGKLLEQYNNPTLGENREEANGDEARTAQRKADRPARLQFVETLNHRDLQLLTKALINAEPQDATAAADRIEELLKDAHDCRNDSPLPGWIGGAKDSKGMITAVCKAVDKLANEGGDDNQDSMANQVRNQLKGRFSGKDKTQSPSESYYGWAKKAVNDVFSPKEVKGRIEEVSESQNRAEMVAKVVDPLPGAADGVNPDASSNNMSPG